ncbi:hypothetical protein CLCR_07845 [Cladophialophora carrionii]|uniref:Uncharacterized protein n=1 Tax=Cladophialophora carrionii TaxID=86049 RepID=A0A1C1CQN2_9EURO|nr:hypothetical protein CLCR_07845 [Cladophialophora carrionii]
MRAKTSNAGRKFLVVLRGLTRLRLRLRDQRTIGWTLHLTSRGRRVTNGQLHYIAIRIDSDLSGSAPPRITIAGPMHI